MGGVVGGVLIPPFAVDERESRKERKAASYRVARGSVITKYLFCHVFVFFCWGGRDDSSSKQCVALDTAPCRRESRNRRRQIGRQGPRLDTQIVPPPASIDCQQQTTETGRLLLLLCLYLSYELL